jgi:hypothetical protein
MLKWVFGVQDTRLRNICKAKISNGDVAADARGKHGKQKTTTPDIEKRIDDHLKSFPTEGSHYTLGSTQEFLDSELTGHRMWCLYLKKHEPCVYRSMFEADDDQPKGQQARPEEGDEELRPVVTYQRYLDHFNAMGLQFAKLASDTCSSCDKAKLGIEAAEGEEKVRLEAEHKAHLQMADKSYALRTRDQTKAFGKGETTTDELPLPFNSVGGIEYLVADFGGNVQLPKLAVGESFYLRKLR